MDGTTIGSFTNSSSDFIVESAVSDKDIIFKVNDGGSSTEVFRFDGDVSSFKIGLQVKRLCWVFVKQSQVMAQT